MFQKHYTHSKYIQKTFGSLEGKKGENLHYIESVQNRNASSGNHQFLTHPNIIRPTKGIDKLDRPGVQAQYSCLKTRADFINGLLVGVKQTCSGISKDSCSKSIINMHF